jgi:hypothetical protein
MEPPHAPRIVLVLASEAGPWAGGRCIEFVFMFCVHGTSITLLEGSSEYQEGHPEQSQIQNASEPTATCPEKNFNANYLCCGIALISGGPFGMIDYEDGDRSFSRIQFQAELLLNRGEERRPGRVGVGIADRGFVSSGKLE